MTGTKTKRTVRDFKKHVLQQAGAEDHFEFYDDGRLQKRFNFWIKLNELGARNMKKQPPETVPDIDATVTLSDEEWDDLDRELQQLL